jgi:hypothetical protein
LFDNAPGVANNHQDTDGDAIGDAIDPTPNYSNPALGDPGLGMGGPYTLLAGSHLLVDYQMIVATPPGAFGHIDLDFGQDGIYDATFFGPLSQTTAGVIDIPPNLFVSSTWDLNTPGSFELFAKAFAPGMSSQYETISGAIDLPEASSWAMIALVATFAIAFRFRS